MAENTHHLGITEQIVSSLKRLDLTKEENMFFVGSEHCDQIWRNFATQTVLKVFVHFLSDCLIFGKILNLLWQIFNTYGQIFIDLNGPKLKK